MKTVIVRRNGQQISYNLEEFWLLCITISS